jgi:hypothetical protein
MKDSFLGMHSHPRGVVEMIKHMPKIVIFDLDGCSWCPKMYELLYFLGGAGAPFTPSEHDNNVLLTQKGERVYLLENVREVMTESYTDKKGDAG